MSDGNQERSLGKVEWLALIILVGAAMLLASSIGGQSSGNQPVPVGTPLPTLMAEGWLNVEGATPGPQSLSGKVVLVDFWGTHCPPCRASMPKLSKLYREYQPMGVEFLGLTGEPSGYLPEIKSFLGSVDDVTWPIGYGAGPTMDMLSIRLLPTYVVFSASGKAVWSGHDLNRMQKALDQALASK